MNIKYVAVLTLLASASAADVVNIGSSCNYAILSKAGVSNTGPTEIDGNVGTSPIAATALTGFALVPTNAGTATFSTSTFVTGNLSGASHLAPTPANLGAAVLDMETAYTDASGRPNPDHVEFLGGILADGTVLTPGIYKWTGVVTTPAGALVNAKLTFDGGGDPDSVWIMQIAGNLALGSYSEILLVNGAKAENIFWAVAGDIAVGTYAHAEGIMLTYTMIALKTGSSLNGAAYAQTAITLDDVTVNGLATGQCAPAPAPTPAPSPAPPVDDPPVDDEDVLCEW